jgi:hypothetical protein
MKNLTQVQYSLGISIYKGKKKHELAPNDRKFLLPKNFQKKLLGIYSAKFVTKFKTQIQFIKSISKYPSI